VTRSLIRKRHAEDNAYVERSHRTDDEEFYAQKGLEMKTLKRRLELLSEWILRFKPFPQFLNYNLLYFSQILNCRTNTLSVRF